ncbi:MAG: hypothetical protein J6Y02_23885 [Pseudobutyrivibrio sp.]|nr:hypothetical protein [Pseudobutyrivibrio sp.]
MTKKELLRQLKDERDVFRREEERLRLGWREVKAGSEESANLLTEIKEVRAMISKIDEELGDLKKNNKILESVKALGPSVIVGLAVIGQTLILIFAEDKTGALTTFASRKMQSPKIPM